MPEKFVGFISYARQDGEAFAAKLRERLEKDEKEITLWMDRSQMAGGVDFEDQIKQAIDSVQYLILVVTPAALRSEWVRSEWRYAREQGVCVCPVKGITNDELNELYKTLPRWISKAHVYDLDKEWERFVLFLKSPCQANRAPFMAPDLPASFVPRPATFDKIINQVLNEKHENPSGRKVVLYGFGGFGKTTLALSVCADTRVKTACEDGILWVTLGEMPSILDELKKLYAALTNDRPAFVSVDDASIELSKRLADRDCLIVIDDVWDADHLKPFLRGEDLSTRLVTTRIGRIANQFADIPGRINVAELEIGEAEQLLMARLPNRPENVAPFRALAQRLGAFPLLLELANATLLDRIAAGQAMEDALEWVNQALDTVGVDVFDNKDSNARNDAIERTLEVSLRLLKDKRQRYLELAVFPDDSDIPLQLAAQVWGTTAFDTERLAVQMNDLSLLKLNLANRTIRLHDAVLAYLRKLAPPVKLHKKLSDTWKDASQVKGAYALRYAVWHLTESMTDPELAVGQGRQLAQLLNDPEFRIYQERHGDLVTLNRELSNALARACTAPDGQAPAVIAGLAKTAKTYTITQEPRWIYDLARQGQVREAEERLDLFWAEPEWRTVSRLLISWLGAAVQPLEAKALAEETAPQCSGPELQQVLEWTRLAPDGVPAGLQPPSGGSDLTQICLILQRAGGSDRAEGSKPLDLSTLSWGMSTPGNIAARDGEPLVEFARLDPAANTKYLRQYIAIHAANRYRYYRNRSLFALLKPIVAVPDALWVRSMVEELAQAALQWTRIDFEDMLPLAVWAHRARAGDGSAANRLEKYRTRLVAEVAGLSPLRGMADSWSHYQRKASALAEIYGLAFHRIDQALPLLQLSRTLPKGFAGYRAQAELTLAEATSLASAADVPGIDAALASAQAAAHKIQDYLFCLESTAMVNAIRRRWWPPTGLDIEAVVGRFVADPASAEFCMLHKIGESYCYRGTDEHTLPIPIEVLRAESLRKLALLYQNKPEELLKANLESGWGLDDSLPPGAEVNIPDPEFVPVLAARLAAGALAAKRTDLIQRLVPLAVPNRTALDTVLGRLLISCIDTKLDMPSILLGLEPRAAGAPTSSEQVMT